MYLLNCIYLYMYMCVCVCVCECMGAIPTTVCHSLLGHRHLRLLPRIVSSSSSLTRPPHWLTVLNVSLL